MSTNDEIIKITITPMYDASGSEKPCGYIKTTYIKPRCIKTKHV